MRLATTFVLILLGLLAVSFGLESLRVALRQSFLVEAEAFAPAGERMGGMLVLNITTAVQALSYLVFLYVMDWVLFRPMLTHLDKRRDAVEAAEEAAAKAEEAAQAVQRKRDERLAEAVREASRERSKIKTEAVTKYQEVVQGARSDADAKVVAARDEIEAAAKKAEVDLDGQVGELAGLVRQKLLREEAGA